MKLLLCLVLLCCSAQAQIDWNYIDQSHEQALRAFVYDHTHDPKFLTPETYGCQRSWKGEFNPTNYGVIAWVLQESHRFNYQPGFEFCAANVRHMLDYCYDWNRHIPGGEGVMGHYFWNYSNDDSDRLRHTHLYQYAMAYLDQAVPLTVGERARLLLMIRDWADGLMSVDWNASRERGTLFQYGRAGIPAMCLMGAYYATSDYKYLMGAEWILLNTFYGLERNLPNGFVSYDTGYEGEGRTAKLLYYAGHNTMENWQLSYLGEAAFHVYANTYNVAVKQYLAQLVINITDWVVRNDVPTGDLMYDNGGGMNLTPMQCGSLFGEWGQRMTPQRALSLRQDEQFYPLVLLKVTEYDGKYWEWNLPNEKRRIHYPGPNGGDPVGPSLSVPLIFTWSDLLLDRYLLTGDKNDLNWSFWCYRDAKYFANRSCASDIRCLADRDKEHYGTGNIGRTRGFSWWARGGLLSGEILRALR